MSESSEVFAVIRSSGERTLPLTLRSLQRQLPPENIVIVEEHPFFAAVLEMLRIASSRTAKYLLAVDADTVLYPNAVQHMLQALNPAKEKNTFRSFFQTRDKFRGLVGAGQHLYRMNWVPDCYAFLKEHGDPFIQRPESENVRIFGESIGVETLDYIQRPVGRHGYYQYYHGIFNTHYNRCVKYEFEREQLIELIQEYHTKYPSDLDAYFALEGAKRGLTEQQVISDAREYFSIEAYLREHQVTEKSPISLTSSRD